MAFNTLLFELYNANFIIFLKLNHYLFILLCF